MYNIEEKFEELDKEIKNIQKKINIDSVVKVFYGISSDGKERISFLTSSFPPFIDSTKIIRVEQGQESENMYWTCFDLLNFECKKVFYTFCFDLLNSITGMQEEDLAMMTIKNRFHNWKLMFKKEITKMSDEKEQGLFGELYFLKHYMIKNYGIEKAINAWVGYANYSKDFSIHDTWYEVKTIGAKANRIKISSINQLSANKTGYLAVICIEKMSMEFDETDCSVFLLFHNIISQIKSNELQEKFVRGVVSYGFNPVNIKEFSKFSVKDLGIYEVKDGFPRILEKDIVYQEIDNVSYEIILKAIEKFRIEGEV